MGSYFDLRSQPHRIDQIPEAREWDCFKRLLVRLNAPESELMTVGCDAFIYPLEPRFGVDFIVRTSAESQPALRSLITQHMDSLHDFLPLTGLVPAI